MDSAVNYATAAMPIYFPIFLRVIPITYFLVFRNGTTMFEVDSGSHSPEHEPDSGSLAQDRDARDLNIFSNDEGVICDQASTTSSHSTSSYPINDKAARTGATLPHSGGGTSDVSSQSLNENKEDRIFSSGTFFSVAEWLSLDSYSF